MDTALPDQQGLRDGFGRAITYARLSLTDRCDMRCRYCMAEDMVFLKRADILSIEELIRLGEAFIARGVRKIRLTGGEPLVRRGALDVVRALGQHVGNGLDELTLTTNGTRLDECAGPLRDAGIRRINVSLDSLDEQKFRHVTRQGDLARVLHGIEAARAAGLAIKINTVALNGINDAELPDLLAWCGERGFDLTLIETMPLGQIDDDRQNRFFPLTAAQDRLVERYDLIPSLHRTGGPARYWDVPALGIKLGLISPLTRNFCDSCNRIRVSASGKLYMCLGHEDHVDLLAAMRSGDEAVFDAAIAQALRLKPRRHDFDLARPATKRHMSATGG